MNVTPKYGFDYESWLDLLNLELWVPQTKRVENNDNDIADPDLDVEMEKEESLEDEDYLQLFDQNEDFGRTSAVNIENDYDDDTRVNIENDDDTSTETKEEDSIDTAVEIDDLEVSTDLTFEQTLEFLDNQIDEFEINQELQSRESLTTDNETSEKIDSENDSDDPKSTNNQVKETDGDIDEIDSEEMEGDEKTDDAVNENTTSATYENLFNLKQKRRPVQGDKILFFSKERNSWHIITLTSYVIKRFLKSGWYYNFVFSDGFRDGTYLHPGQPYWGLLTNDEAARMDVSNVIPLLHDVDESENHSDEDKPEEKQ